MRLNSLSTPNYRRLKYLTMLSLDVGAAVVALCVAAVLLADFSASRVIFRELATAIPLTIVASGATFYFTGVSKRVWRFFSVRDLTIVVLAAAMTAVTSYLALNLVGAGARLPISFLFLQWGVLTTAMAGLRLARRSAPGIIRSLTGGRASQADENAPLALVAGQPEDVELVLRKAETAGGKAYRPIAVLDETEVDVRRTIRGVAIRGGLEALNSVVNDLSAVSKRPEMLIIASENHVVADQKYIDLASRARSLGLKVVRVNVADDLDGNEVRLRPFDMSDLLGRPPADLDTSAIMRAVCGRRVVVTGAGGTIGGELTRQIASIGPDELVLLEAGEFNLYQIEHEIRTNFPDVNVVPLLCDIRNRSAVMAAFERCRPHVVFHAAALKHVPLVEQNPCAGVETNVLGTRNVADAAAEYGATAMVQVSTDKAVNPVGVMGATKRLGELYCQALDLEGGQTRFMTVRFGNVLGSSGSVIPLFQKQLRQRMPLTVTDPEMTRFFMTVHEAVQLILQSMQGALEQDTLRGRIFVLDMGEPIKILDIAQRMVRLSGLRPDVDVNIEIVGKRPGEKLFEELFDAEEEQLPSRIKGVFEAEPAPIALDVLERAFANIADAVAAQDELSVREQLFALIKTDGRKGGEAAASRTAVSGPRLATSNNDIRVGA